MWTSAGHNWPRRNCDGLPTLDEVAAVAAIAQCLVEQMDGQLDRGFRLPEARAWVVRENKWRAARYGLEGKLVDFGKQKEVSARDLVMEYLEFVDDVVDELDSREELNYIHKILEMGTGADRQLRVFRETGDLKKVVDYIIEETEVGVAEEATSSSARKVG